MEKIFMNQDELATKSEKYCCTIILIEFEQSRHVETKMS